MTATIDTKTALPTGTWTLDPVHSQVGFAVDYMVGTFRGSFFPVDAKLTVVEDGTATLTGSAPVSAVKVHDENLVTHLQSPEFFDTERTPEITFASKEIRREGDRITVDGELTIKGLSQPVTLEGSVTDPIEDPYGNSRIGLNLSTTVDRTAFGIDWNNPLPSGDPSLANDVTLTADLYLVKA